MSGATIIRWKQGGYGFAESHCGFFEIRKAVRDKGYVLFCGVTGDALGSGHTQMECKERADQLYRRALQRAANERRVERRAIDIGPPVVQRLPEFERKEAE